MNLLKLTKRDWLDCLYLLIIYTICYVIGYMFFQGNVIFTEYFQGFTICFVYALGKASMLSKEE